MHRDVDEIAGFGGTACGLFKDRVDLLERVGLGRFRAPDDVLGMRISNC